MNKKIIVSEKKKNQGNKNGHHCTKGNIHCVGCNEAIFSEIKNVCPKCGRDYNCKYDCKCEKNHGREVSSKAFCPECKKWTLIKSSKNCTHCAHPLCLNHRDNRGEEVA